MAPFWFKTGFNSSFHLTWRSRTNPTRHHIIGPSMTHTIGANRVRLDTGTTFIVDMNDCTKRWVIYGASYFCFPNVTDFELVRSPLLTQLSSSTMESRCIARNSKRDWSDRICWYPLVLATLVTTAIITMRMRRKEDYLSSHSIRFLLNSHEKSMIFSSRFYFLPLMELQKHNFSYILSFFMCTFSISTFSCSSNCNVFHLFFRTSNK